MADVFEGLFCTDEDVAALILKDYNLVVPEDQVVAVGTDATFLVDSWTLRSLLSPPGTQGVQPGHVVLLNPTANARAGLSQTSIWRRYGVVSAADTDVVLRQLGGAAGFGQPPVTVAAPSAAPRLRPKALRSSALPDAGGDDSALPYAIPDGSESLPYAIPDVQADTGGGGGGDTAPGPFPFLVPTARPQIVAVTTMLKVRFQIADATTLVGSQDMARACAVWTVVVLYRASARQFGLNQDDYAAKSKRWELELQEVFAILDPVYGVGEAGQTAYSTPLLDDPYLRIPDLSGGVRNPEAVRWPDDIY